MLFHSQPFLVVFLPIVLVGQWILSGRRDAREWFLILASLVFYGWWDVRFLPLLAGSVAVNWALGAARLWLGARWLLPVGIAADLALLVYFKYWDFLGGALADGLGLPFAPVHATLPLGISFFTFQQISYLMDLRSGRAPLYRFRSYLLYATVFPHLIAGPIVRHNELIGQFESPPAAPERLRMAGRGVTLLVAGLIKKVALADPFAHIADPVFAAAAAGTVATADAWTGLLAYTFQIYFDFSGYTDMAIGLGLMLGMTFPPNFDAPYRATSLREFWRRWHMTLSRFLRDYLYIPLGGSRHGAVRQGAALLATMSLCGLWHGAGWTFVAWGAVHGAGLVANALWRRAGLSLPPLAGWAATLAFVSLAWVLFRSPDLATASALYASLAGVGGAAVTYDASAVLFVAAAAVALLLPTSQRVVEQWIRPWPWLAVAQAVALVALLLEVGKDRAADFIYFQF
jgi:D-alanyl-lipoteichoic acid acyltransferase DltB (MBOAT superfamily)